MRHLGVLIGYENPVRTLFKLEKKNYDVLHGVIRRFS
jgi:hypothetical protein